MTGGRKRQNENRNKMETASVEHSPDTSLFHISVQTNNNACTVCYEVFN